ncbi:MAG: GAF domain-containing protein, partial [Anaerolineales bacterium]|nr:GAF domain-containing protein [Anaerolineales bacterium]
MARDTALPDPPAFHPPQQRLLTLLQKISLAVDRASSIDEAFAEVLAAICRFMDWPLGHVYVWSEEADALVSSRVWYTADASTIAPFRELSEATVFRRDEGTLGMVWRSQKALSILDVRDETVFVRRMPVEEGGIRAYFAFPVMMENRVMAVLEFFSPESKGPEPDMTSVINHVSALLGLAMQRQQTLNKLQQREAQLAEAQHTAHVGHWEWDMRYNRVTWSPEVKRIFGLSERSEANYAEFMKRIHPDDLAYVQRKLHDAFEHGRMYDFFHRVVRPNGSLRVLHMRGRPIRDVAGKVVGLYGTVQDMTEQKETELKLAQTVRRLSALMEIGQAVAATLDLDEIYNLVLTLVRPLVEAEAVILFLHRDGMLEVTDLDRDGVPDMRGLRVPDDSGIVGEVWQHGRSRFLRGPNCVQRLSPLLVNYVEYQPQAMIAVPIRWQGEAIGVLEATHHETTAFDREDLHLLETAAAWMAIAVGNARQYEQLQRRLSESNAIAEISNVLTETLELEELLSRVARRVHKVFLHADGAMLHLLQPKSNVLQLAASAGMEAEQSSDVQTLNLEEGLARCVMGEGAVVNVTDVPDDPRLAPEDRRTAARSLLVVPIESRLRRLGMLTLRCAMPGAFNADDEKTLSVLGLQVGMAIENARLYAAQEQATRRAEKQRERMRHMARRVVSAQEKERARIARELHDESGQALTSLKIGLDLIRSQLPDELAPLKDSLADLLSHTEKTMSSLRLLSHNLRPPGLDAYGLNAALEGLCQDFAHHSSVAITYSGVDVPSLSALAELSLYRFAQEGLTNAMKHAAATHIEVNLVPEPDVVILTVTDNGRGFVPPDLDENIPSEGVGL